MDFYSIKERSTKNGVIEIYPDFKICRSKDLMIRGKSFYAIWDEQKGLWSTDEYDVQRLVDKELMEHLDILRQKTDNNIIVKLMSDFSSGSWTDFRNYINHVSDNSHDLDDKLIFANTNITKKDYASKRLNYSLEDGKIDAFNELIETLYDPEEKDKLEWAIGAVISGDAKQIQKFIVLYGEGGTGKSTILNIIQKLFDGYYTTFDAKSLTSTSNAFATEVFKSNPLVAIQHDGDLSKIEDNTKLNSLVSHEEMTMNEKYKPSYTAKVNCFLFLGTNKPVKITDAKSGIIRRLIDVKPSGRKIPPQRYQTLISLIDFELGAIANHCLNIYRQLGKNYYSTYRPLSMMFQTDVFFNFIESNYFIFKEQDGVTLTQAYDMYKAYCDESLVEYKTPKYKFREELKNYFSDFYDITRVNGNQIRSYYSGFLFDKLVSKEKIREEHQLSLVLDSTISLFDEYCKDCKAQYASIKETPIKNWSEVKTTLANIDTSKLHYVNIPEIHIIVDFDLKGEDGNKSLEKNIEAASKFPPTYAELSKSGSGIHLHYIYDGDINELSRIYSEGIEIKIYNGNSALRRKLTKCNNVPIAHIKDGLPLKKGNKMINFKNVKSEQGLRNLIKRNLNKEINPGTKSSIDFINKILNDAYDSGLIFDVTDMRPSILTFANNSTNNSDYCVKLVGQMKFKSDTNSWELDQTSYSSDELVFFDVEVYPNLFIVVWKPAGKPEVRMINPSPKDIEMLFSMKLVGFNCRKYDNHMLYARYIGYSNEQLYNLSQKIINGSKNCMFGEAYNISYTDVYDFASAGNKKSLKKWEIELGIHHQEMGLPWNKPVDENLWIKVSDYCTNDVVATETVFNHLTGDWIARQILAELSGLTVNDTTNSHSTKIIFGDNKHPQDQFIYTDLSEMFPGYKYENGKSTYRGEDIGEGGKVYAEPGMYVDVALLDVASQHPTSLEELELFGPVYTKRFSDIKNSRLAIKHENYDVLSNLLDGKLVKFLNDDRYTAEDLASGLKTVINSVYGLTSAKFENPFKDPRNIDNIVAKRGALFMTDLKFAVQEKGFTVAHIKTDSIKIPNATPEIINFVMEFGKKYGYEFEHEATYSKMCLVNDAVYIAKYDDKGIRNKGGKHANEWIATGAQFAQPYVFKTLFSKEPILFEDMCETKSVTTSIYLDMNNSLDGVNDPNYQFIGKVGLFCPIKPNKGGGTLLREKDGKYYAVGGSKGYYWLESELVKELGKQDDIDKTYYNSLVDKAIDSISKFGDFYKFIEQESYCKKEHCLGCENWQYTINNGICTCQAGYTCEPF